MGVEQAGKHGLALQVDRVVHLGGSRLPIARLFAAEITIVVVASALLCAIGLVIINQFSDELVRTLFIR